MSAEKPKKPAKKEKVVKPRPDSKVVPARSKADKARPAQKENFVQVSIPKSLATMSEEEIMQWAKGLYKAVVEQLAPAVIDQVAQNPKPEASLSPRARRYLLTSTMPVADVEGSETQEVKVQAPSEDLDEYLRDMAGEYGMNPSSNSVIEELRLYL
ncbi:MAG: hypothetical protein EBS36_03690 [Actinobacteria bacterium]|nr:hypothetical protein [Actinomycetota bacterium]NBY15657.1 hypothetical protein [Actinomycetota bacterium]